MLPLFQPVGTSSDCHNLSSMRDSGLATSFGSSFRTHGCTSSAHMDFCTFRFLWWLKTWFSPTVGGSSFSLPLPFVIWVVCWEHLLVKIEMKKVAEYLSLLHVPHNHILLQSYLKTIQANWNKEHIHKDCIMLLICHSGGFWLNSLFVLIPVPCLWNRINSTSYLTTFFWGQRYLWVWCDNKIT